MSDLGIGPGTPQRGQDGADGRRAQRLWQFARDPDPVDANQPIGWLEGALSWPVRCILVAGTLAAAWAWQDSGVGRQLASGLQIGAVALMAIVVAFWVPVLLVDAALAVLWFERLQP